MLIDRRKFFQATVGAVATAAAAPFVPVAAPTTLTEVIALAPSSTGPYRCPIETATFTFWRNRNPQQPITQETLDLIAKAMKRE